MPRSSSSPDIVIVGAGVAGSSLAILLARSGQEVIILEKSLEHKDRVRGEFIVPWGVATARDIGLLGILESAGANYTTKSIGYGEGTTPEDARLNPTRMDQMVPNVRGALNLSHTKICNTLNRVAIDSGATLLRGVERIRVTSGHPPRLCFLHDGIENSISPRIVVGADGRGSSIARQVGLKSQADPIHHLFTGLLVDGADDWPEDEQSIGVDGDVGFYVLPQGGGQVRLYAAHSLDQRGRYSGEGAVRRFLSSFDRPSIPFGRALSLARPIGPCNGYANNDVWIDEPIAPGIVLIGDAAGYSDPSGGQGISIALKDAHLVAKILSSAKNWTSAALTSFVELRREQMRRVRFSTRLLASFRMEFTQEARQRRARGRERMATRPELVLPFAALQKGPFAVPESAFSEETRSSLLN